MSTLWPIVKVGEVFDVQLGKMLSPKAKKGKQSPYLGNFNVQWGNINFDKLNTMHFSDREKSKYALQKNDILMCEGGEIGRCAIWLNQQENCYYQKALHRLRALDKNSINAYYFYVYMEHIASNNGLVKIVGETSIAHLTREKLRELKFPLPPIAKQKQIAEIFKSWDKNIEKIETLIALKEKQFTWLTQVFFTPKSSWKSYKLSDLFENRREAKNINLPLLSITREKGVVSHSEINRKDSSNKDKSKYLRICPNDIGYNTMRMWQGVSALSGLEGIVSPAYTVCTPTEDVDPEFMAFLFKTKPMIHKFYRYSQGLTSDTWNLKFHHFSEIETSIPDLKTQREIAKVLRTAQKEISTLKLTLEKYRRQKRGLMQKLLTGEWQVPSQSTEKILKEVKT